MSFFDKLFKKQPQSLSSMQENECTLSEANQKDAKDTALENIDGASLLDQHEKGLIDDKTFLHSFGKAKVFYSTPFGNHKDGDSRLFILPAQDKTAFLPVFSSAERATEFYEKAGRRGYLILEGTFTEFLETTKKMNQGKTPIKLGAVIDPGYYGMTMGANMLDSVINMAK